MLVAGAAGITLLPSAAAAQIGARFVGRVRTEWDEDGRHMILLEPYGYVDPTGLEWTVAAGEKIDGASIPQWAWSFIGGPYEGAYRKGSVIHDHYCRVKTRTWQATHLMFFQAMLTAGVGAVQAGVMYGAVLLGGPKWRIVVVRRSDLAEVRNVFGQNDRLLDVYARLATTGAIEAAGASSGGQVAGFDQKFAAVRENSPQIGSLAEAWLRSAEPRTEIASDNATLAAQVLGSQNSGLVIGLEEEATVSPQALDELRSLLEGQEAQPEQMAERVQELVDVIRSRGSSSSGS